MNRKCLIIEAVVLLALIAILLWYNIPFSVNQQISALEIKMDDPSYCVERTITLDGKRHRNLFSDDIFRGSLTVSGYEDMIADRTMDDLQLGNRYGIGYSKQIDDELDWFYLGGLFMENRFENAVIGFVYNPDGHYSTENCYVIVAGAADRDEAYCVAEETFWSSE